MELDRTSLIRLINNLASLLDMAWLVLRLLQLSNWQMSRDDGSGGCFVSVSERIYC